MPTITGRNVYTTNNGFFCSSISGNMIVGCDLARQESEDQITNYIKQWNYIPNMFKFHKVKDEEDLFLGIELEIDKGGENEDVAKYVYDFMNSNDENIYCKHDGSLDDGFEIVTHPCTLDYHKTLPYEELFDYLIKHGYKSHDTNTCGFHIHFNRNYFGIEKLEQDLNISKLLYLFEKHWINVELIARRKSNRYAERFTLSENESPLDIYAKSKSADKYGAINLEHENTVEIRIFKGTLKYDTLIATLEFVDRMAHIVKETDIYKIQFVTWDKIIETFPENLNQYILNRKERLNQPDIELSEIQKLTGEIYLLEEKLKRKMNCRERRELKKQITTLKRELKKFRRR